MSQARFEEEKIGRIVRLIEGISHSPSEEYRESSFVPTTVLLFVSLIDRLVKAKGRQGWENVNVSKVNFGIH